MFEIGNVLQHISKSNTCFCKHIQPSCHPLCINFQHYVGPKGQFLRLEICFQHGTNYFQQNVQPLLHPHALPVVLVLSPQIHVSEDRAPVAHNIVKVIWVSKPFCVAQIPLSRKSCTPSCTPRALHFVCICNQQSPFQKIVQPLVHSFWRCFFIHHPLSRKSCNPSCTPPCTTFWYKL